MDARYSPFKGYCGFPPLSRNLLALRFVIISKHETIDTAGLALTVTLIEPLFEHPDALVAFTVIIAGPGVPQVIFIGLALAEGVIVPFPPTTFQE